MRYLLIIITFFILTVEALAVTDLKEGEIYSGTMPNVFYRNNTLVLPPGSWKAYEIKRSTQTGYAMVSFKNTKDSSQEAYYSFPTTSHEGRWRGQGDPICEDHEEVFARGKTSGQGAQFDRWCVSKDRGWIYFVNQRAQINPQMKFNYTAFYFRSGSIDINSNIAEKYGKKINEVFRASTIGKKNLNLDFMSELTKKSSSSSSSSNNSSSSSSTKIDLSWSNDRTICNNATSREGFWNYSGKMIREYREEAESRNLSLEDCNKLTGRGKSKAQTEEKEGSIIEQKLKKLKKLLSDDLITQEDYDKKKAEYLENF